MAIQVAREMLQQQYTWNAVSDGPETSADSRLFNRKEGKEVLDMIQAVVNYFGYHTPHEVTQVEQTISDQLPGSVRGWHKVMQWLINNLRFRDINPPRPMTSFRSFVAPRLADIEPEFFMPRHLLPEVALAPEATTLGWDTVNAIRLPLVNKTLLESKLYPKTFNKDMGNGWTLQGGFSAWSVQTGGSGAIVFMRTPVQNVKMTFTGSPDLEFTDGYVAISIKLEYLPQPPATAAAAARSSQENGDPQYLTRNAEARSADDPAVVIQNVNYGGHAPDPMMDALFRGSMGKWFNDNLDQFTYVFTVVNINAMAAQAAFQWLKPTYTSYAYFNGADENSSYFGILNMTKNNSPEGLTNQLPPSAIPDGKNASLLIANNSFLKEMVLPGLPKAFTHAAEEDFQVVNKETMIENTREIQMDDVKVDGINYTPYLLEFKFQIVGDEIQVNSKTKVTISPGIHTYVISTNFYRLTLVDKPEGGQTIDYVESRAAKSDSWYEKEDWVVITEIIVGIIGAVATIVGGAVVKTLVRRIIAVIIIAIVAGLAAALPELIARILAGKTAEALPAIGPMVTEATGDIEWPKSSGFTLQSAELNGSLQLGGDLSYAAS